MQPGACAGFSCYLAFCRCPCLLTICTLSSRHAMPCRCRACSCAACTRHTRVETVCCRVLERVRPPSARATSTHKLKVLSCQTFSCVPLSRPIYQAGRLARPMICMWHHCSHGSTVTLGGQKHQSRHPEGTAACSGSDAALLTAAVSPYQGRSNRLHSPDPLHPSKACMADAAARLPQKPGPRQLRQLPGTARGSHYFSMP